MTKEEFRSWAASGTILLDGATGSNMLQAGMPRGCCTEYWVMEHKDVIQKLQNAYIEAGSEIIYAPTFGGSRLSLSKHGYGDEVRKINQTLVQYAKEVAEGRALVAGNITTTGRMVDLDPEYSPTMAYENYCEQLDAQISAGLDLIVVETMISVRETEIALAACRNLCDLPVICTLSVRADGRTYYDGSIIEQAWDLEDAGAMAIGVNCSVSPDALVDVIKKLKAKAHVPIVVKPNTGLPDTDIHGHAVYTHEPEKYADQMMVLHEAGATILGGCCGTTPEHIRQMAIRLKKDCIYQNVI